MLRQISSDGEMMTMMVGHVRILSLLCWAIHLSTLSVNHFIEASTTSQHAAGSNKGQNIPKSGPQRGFRFFPRLSNATEETTQEEQKDDEVKPPKNKEKTEPNKGADSVQLQKEESDPAKQKGEKAEPATTKKNRWRPRNPLKRPTKQKEPSKPDEKDKNEKETEKKDAQKHEEPPSRPAQNATTMDTQNQTATAPVPQQGSGFIVMGAPGSPYRLYQRQAPPQVMPGQQQRMVPPQMTQNSNVLLIELAASIFGTVGRLWFLTWLARRVATQEESIQPTQHFAWERLNDRFCRDAAALKTALSAPPLGISKGRWRRKHVRKQGRRPRQRPDWNKTFARTVVVVELNHNSKGNVDLNHLSDVVTFLLRQHRDHAFGTQKAEGNPPMELEVVFLIQSPGGSVAAYGLAAAQVQRLSREQGVAVTACVDKYAASGGYMIASQASKLVAAPFASVGSVGVIVEGLNFHELARRHGIEPLVLKAGNSKNPFTTYGSITRQDKEREQERLEKVHDAFKELVVSGRPFLEDRLNQVADGSVFLGQEALDLQMIDAVMTSDEYLLERIQAGDRVLRLHRSQQARFPRRVTLSPLDVLPHLRTWFCENVLANLNHEDTMALVSRLVQMGSFLGFAQHLLQRYFSQRP